ncbi:MAG: hypothetical protein SVZ03_01900 [Spirochaetota bacterium]|nr:hypothetical protein [Spirochaetota bacterium]
MPEEIQTITDKNSFEKILKYFLNNPAYLKSDNGNIKVQFFQYHNDKAAFRIQLIKKIQEDSVIFTRHHNNTIYAYLKFFERQGEDTFLFIPSRFQIMTDTRKENRISLNIGGEERKIIYVSNIISDLIIKNSLAMEIKKTDRIKEMFKNNIANKYKHLKIYFCNEGMNDPRMKYFFAQRKPIFIPDINNPQSVKDDNEFNSYINNIYSKDIYLKSNAELISEISVPLLYKMKMPYGYIKIHSDAPFAESIFSIVKKVAIKMDELIIKNKIFPISEDKLIVSNVSRSGLGLAFKKKKLIRYFKENCIIYGEMILPEYKKASLIAVVKHISILSNNIIHVGLEISEMDALSEINYEEFLESIDYSSE